MPFIEVITKNINDIKNPLRLKVRLRTVCSDQFCVKKEDFSIRFNNSHVLDELTSDIEIRIYAHNNPNRLEKLDLIPELIENSLRRFKYNNVKVFLFLQPIGFSQD